MPIEVPIEAQEEPAHDQEPRHAEPGAAELSDYESEHEQRVSAVRLVGCCAPLLASRVLDKVAIGVLASSA